MQDTLEYYDTKKDSPGDAARVAARVVEHIYYREQVGLARRPPRRRHPRRAPPPHPRPRPSHAPSPSLPQHHFDTAQSNALKRKQLLLTEYEAKAAEAKAAEAAAVQREEELKEEEGDDDDDDESGDDDDDAPKVKEACAERKAADAAAAVAKAAKAAHAEFGVPRPMELRREIASLSRRVYAAGSDRNKTRTLLCSVYHHALHGRYFEARDMLLTSHLGDAIHDRDIQTQILYNRAMARCGLCAFELQLLPEAHSALMELAGGSRLKEMLAQGISNSHFRDRAAEKEQEKAERRRLVPYHMWINLDLVEAVHLVTAMLLELPNLAHNAYDPKRRSAPVSRTFRRYLDQHERQVFTGPPEGTRDYVMRTSKLLLDGEWKRAADLVCEMPVSLLPKKEGIHEYLRKQMRERGSAPTSSRPTPTSTRSRSRTSRRA